MISCHYRIKCIDKERDYIEKNLLCKINVFISLGYRYTDFPIFMLSDMCMYVYVNK